MALQLALGCVSGGYGEQGRTCCSPCNCVGNVEFDIIGVSRGCHLNGPLVGLCDYSNGGIISAHDANFFNKVWQFTPCVGADGFDVFNSSTNPKTRRLRRPAFEIGTNYLVTSLETQWNFTTGTFPYYGSVRYSLGGFPANGTLNIVRALKWAFPFPPCPETQSLSLVSDTMSVYFMHVYFDSSVACPGTSTTVTTTTIGSITKVVTNTLTCIAAAPPNPAGTVRKFESQMTGNTADFQSGITIPCSGTPDCYPFMEWGGNLVSASIGATWIS